MDPKFYKHFGLTYGVLAFVLALSLFGLVETLNTKAASASKASVRHVQTELGSSNVAKLAIAEVQRQASQYGLTVTKQKVVSVKQEPGGAFVVVAVTLTDTASGKSTSYRLRVEFGKSLYTVKSVSQA